MSGVQISKCCIVVAPASPNFNVVFGLHAWVWWTNKSNPERRGKLHRLSFNIEVWGVRFYLVDVCRVWFVCPSTVVSTVVPTTSLPRSPFWLSLLPPFRKGVRAEIRDRTRPLSEAGAISCSTWDWTERCFSTHYTQVWVCMGLFKAYGTTDFSIYIYICVCVWYIHMFSINHLSIGAPNFDPYPAWWMVGKWFVFSWGHGWRSFSSPVKNE